MISGLADGMGLDFAPVIAPHVGRLVNLVLVSTRIEDPDVRQSAFALIGDLTSIAFGHVQYASTQFVIAIESCLDPRYPSSCNNAVWALGELALRMGKLNVEIYIYIYHSK